MSESLLLWTVFKFEVSPLSLSLSAYNSSALADIILVKADKNFSKFVAKLNVTNYTATADTVQLDMHMARIAKDKTYIITSI